MLTRNQSLASNAVIGWTLSGPRDIPRTQSLKDESGQGLALPGTIKVPVTGDSMTGYRVCALYKGNLVCACGNFSWLLNS